MKTALYWIAAILITLGAIVYQKKTGPTYEKKVSIRIGEKEYLFNLIRSHGGETDCLLELEISDQDVTGMLEYRKYPTHDDWTRVKMERKQDFLSGSLPNLPPAGKYEYRIILEKHGEQYPLNNGNPVVIRFKGDVPAAILVPHIFFMFFAMLLSNLAGIMAVFRHRRYRFFTNITLLALLVGGMILGPWVQWYAFGEAWAGVPFAWDLTDNKTLLAFIFWILAWAMNRKKERPVYSILASLIMFAIYLIPHSMYGSELDPETGEIIQGWVGNFWLLVNH